MQVVITTTVYICVCVFVSFCAVTIVGYLKHLQSEGHGSLV
jgi:hypothetical protein